MVNTAIPELRPRFPNLYIVGAPKAGTSSLFQYLGQHPEIFMSPIKEPRFFARDIGPSIPFLNESQYLSLFTAANSERYLGEAGAWNLFSREAASRIHRARPDAKILISLRRPTEYVRSMFYYNKSWLLEDSSDLTEALELEPERYAGGHLNHRCVIPERLFYLKTAKYFEQVKKYYDLFGKENVFVIPFEQLVIDTAKTVNDIFDFLGLASGSLDLKRTSNRTYTYRSRFVREIIVDESHKVRILCRRVVRNHKVRRLVFRSIRKANSKPLKKQPLPIHTSKMLAEFGKKEAALLAGLTGIDFPGWWGGKGYQG